VATLATNVVVGAFHGHFLAVWGVAALFVLALGIYAILGAVVVITVQVLRARAQPATASS
jgi:hypothetical protein